jgi:dehydrogenase/reductase SDR family protein 7B
MDLADKVIWITGASSGIGEALARELAGRGAYLVLSARREAELERVRAALDQPRRHRVVPLDLSRPETFPGLVDEVNSATGGVDILINNGGVSQRSLVRDTDLAVDRRLMDINFFGPVALTKAVLPGMVQRGGGMIVVVTSLVGELSTPLRSAYAASKHALHGWFDALRAEEHDNKIRVLLAMPGFIRTDLPLHALTGDGGSQGQMDAAQQAGMAPARCARQMVRAVQNEREQVIIAGRERAGVYLKRPFPGLFRKLIRRVKVT